MGFLSRLFGGKESQPAPAPVHVKPVANEIYDFRHIRDLNNVLPLDTCSSPENASFQLLLEKYFADCDLKYAVPAADLFPQAPAYAMPVNFLITKGEKKLAIILLDAKHVRRYAYLETKELCKENGIDFMTFFLHLPNEDNYVAGRIKIALG